MYSPESLRAFLFELNNHTFVATAAHHRSEEANPVDHYAVSYVRIDKNAGVSSAIEELSAQVIADDIGFFGFRFGLTKRGRQSTPRLGKLIIAHVMMDFSTGKFLPLYLDNDLLESSTVHINITTVIGDAVDDAENTRH